MKELQKIPSVDALLISAEKAQLFGKELASVKSFLARCALTEVRTKVLAGQNCPTEAEILENFKKLKDQLFKQKIRRVINATGIVLHTNLGRAPLSSSVMKRISELSTGWCNMEFDLSTGQRGNRGAYITRILPLLTGTEKALVVNNGASAVFLMLAALAKKKEVIISRGELVQIGGGFRIPDILEESGAILREVGTTNITTIKDYESAINENTAMILKVHRSNFFLQGHTEESKLSELASLAKSHQLILAMDLGSGAIVDTRHYDFLSEPTVQEIARQNVDLIAFSGDKLLGGPQSGLILGKTALIEKMGKHPLYRIMRPGRLILTALQEVMNDYLCGNSEAVSIWSTLKMDLSTLKNNATFIQDRLQADKIPSTLMEGEGPIGGGSTPDQSVKTMQLVIKPKKSSEFLRSLRSFDPPIIPLVEKDSVIFDLRTIFPDELETMSSGIIQAWENSR